MEKRKSKRSLRVALVLGAAFAGTALIGWGGLAAWQAYTANTGNSITAYTMSHSNTVGSGSPCSSVTSLSGATSQSCGVIIDATAETSSSTLTNGTGTVTITSTGEAASSFAMYMPSAPASSASDAGFCADLNLSVTDSKGSYYNASLSGAMGTSTSPIALNDSGGNSLWPGTSGTAGTNTFTFTVTGPGLAADNSAPGGSCSFDVVFVQSA